MMNFEGTRDTPLSVDSREEWRTMTGLGGGGRAGRFFNIVLRGFAGGVMAGATVKAGGEDVEIEKEEEGEDDEEEKAEEEEEEGEEEREEGSPNDGIGRAGERWDISALGGAAVNLRSGRVGSGLDSYPWVDVVRDIDEEEEEEGRREGEVGDAVEETGDAAGEEDDDASLASNTGAADTGRGGGNESPFDSTEERGEREEMGLGEGEGEGGAAVVGRGGGAEERVGEGSALRRGNGEVEEAGWMLDRAEEDETVLDRGDNCGRLRGSSGGLRVSSPFLLFRSDDGTLSRSNAVRLLRSPDMVILEFLEMSGVPGDKGEEREEEDGMDVPPCDCFLFSSATAQMMSSFADPTLLVVEMIRSRNGFSKEKAGSKYLKRTVCADSSEDEEAACTKLVELARRVNSIADSRDGISDRCEMGTPGKDDKLSLCMGMPGKAVDAWAEEEEEGGGAALMQLFTRSVWHS
jgi:hypothetical protein